MAIIFDKAAFDDYLLGTLPGLVPSEIKARYPNDKTGQINTVLGKIRLLFDRYLVGRHRNRRRCASDGSQVFICGIMEHIEEADPFGRQCLFAAAALACEEKIAELEDQTKRFALALGVGGLMNVQCAEG